MLYHGRVDRCTGALDLVEAFAELLKESAIRPQMYIESKSTACTVYASQIDFQFGDADKLKAALQRFHRSEATRINGGFLLAEVFLASSANQGIFDKSASSM